MSTHCDFTNLSISGGVGETAGVQVTSGQILVDENDFFEVYGTTLNNNDRHAEAFDTWFELEVIA